MQRQESSDKLVPPIVKGHTGHMDCIVCLCARDLKCVISGTLLKLNRHESISYD